jgi:hypothetical protein
MNATQGERKMTTSQDLIRQEVEKLINTTKERFKDVQRFALDEAWKVLQLSTAAVVQIIEAIGDDLSNPDKKILAMELLTGFYDKVFIVVDIPFVPNIVESIIHKYIKSILMIMVSASIDATVTIFRNTGVFIKREAGL